MCMIGRGVLHHFTVFRVIQIGLKLSLPVFLFLHFKCCNAAVLKNKIRVGCFFFSCKCCRSIIFYLLYTNRVFSF